MFHSTFTLTFRVASELLGYPPLILRFFRKGGRRSWAEIGPAPPLGSQAFLRVIVSSYIPDDDPSSGFSCRGTFCKAVASSFHPRTAPHLPGAAFYDPQPLPGSIFLSADTLRKEDALPRTAFLPFAKDCCSRAQRHQPGQWGAVWHEAHNNARSSIASNRDACMVLSSFWYNRLLLSYVRMRERMKEHPYKEKEPGGLICFPGNYKYSAVETKKQYTFSTLFRALISDQSMFYDSHKNLLPF